MSVSTRSPRERVARRLRKRAKTRAEELRDARDGLGERSLPLPAYWPLAHTARPSPRSGEPAGASRTAARTCVASCATRFFERPALAGVARDHVQRARDCVSIEGRHREERRVRTSLRLSALPVGQTLANFDWSF